MDLREISTGLAQIADAIEGKVPEKIPPDAVEVISDLAHYIFGDRWMPSEEFGFLRIGPYIHFKKEGVMDQVLGGNVDDLEILLSVVQQALKTAKDTDFGDDSRLIR